MAYFRKIEEAEACLSRGDLLGAEALLAEARTLHLRSRFRAPLVERGIDPVLRVGRRLLRRGGSGPVLPNFPVRAAALEGELSKLARRREREAAELALIEDDELLPEHGRACAEFLLLHRESRHVDLPAAIVWRLMRSYLLTHAEGFDDLEADLLPEPFDVPEDQRGWLERWVRRWLREAEGRPLRLAQALLRWAESFAADDAGSNPSWSFLAARLALAAGQEGPRALGWGRLALDLPLGAEDAWANLRLVASLECNHQDLATTGAQCRYRLTQLGDHPAARGRVWPPRDLDEMLRRRDPEPDRPGVVVAQASEDGRRLLLLRMHRERPVDAVCLEVESEASVRGPFGVGPTRGRELVESWLHPGDMVLLPHRLEGEVGGLIPADRSLVVAELETSLPEVTTVFAAAPAASSHPLFQEGADRGVWTELYQQARPLLPRALARLESRAFCTAWGRENLRRLASVGLSRCRALGALVEILVPSVEGGEGTRLQELPTEPPLLWPLLCDREWPAAGTPISDPVERIEEDLVIAHRPSLPELATEALAFGRSCLLVEEEDRAREVTAILAATIDPRRVTWQRHSAACPRAELECLGRWIGQSLSDGDKELDVLWLYQALSTTPEAAVDAFLDQELRPAAHAELEEERRRQAARECCGEDCRLRETEGGCWPRQLRERRAQGRVWMGSVSCAGEEAGEAVVVDDLSGWVGATDAEVNARFARLRERLEGAPHFLLHAEAGAFGESLEVALGDVLPTHRRPTLHTRVWTHSIDVLAVPPGYAPSARLIAEESEALLRERLRLWDEDTPGCPRWDFLAQPAPDSAEDTAGGSAGVPAGEGDAVLRGRASQPRARVVLVPRLGEGGEVSALVQLLRLALASTHSSQALVCFDPRMAEALPRLAGRIHVPASVNQSARALATGAEIFGTSRAHRPGGWTTPLSGSRLRWALEELGEGDKKGDEELVSDFADRLRTWTSSSHLVFAGAPDRCRKAVARLVLELARESGDGGALGIRRVVWVGQGSSPFGEGGDVLEWEPGLELPTEGILGLHLRPEHLRHPGLRSWATQGTAWILAHGESHFGDGVLARGWGLPPLESGAGLLAFTDDGRAALRSEIASRLGAHSVSWDRPWGVWTWRRHRAPDHHVQCEECGFEATVEHPMSLCGRCGHLILQPEECESASRQQRVAGLREQLRESDGDVLVIAVDRGQRDELRHQLGLAVFDGEEGSLWDGRTARQAFGHEVVAVADLCDRKVAPSRILLDHLPADASLVRALILRLQAQGWSGGCIEALDHPLQWHSDRPLRRDVPADPWSDLAGRRLRWEASRAEIEFRFSQALNELRRSLAQRAGGREDSFLSDFVQRGANTSEAALWEALRTDDPGRTRLSAEDAELFVRARAWMGQTLAQASEAGLGLDPPREARLLLSELGETPLLARRAALLLAWARRERLLSVSEEDSAPPSQAPTLCPQLRRCPKGEELRLRPELLEEGASAKPETAETECLAPGFYYALARTGRTTQLVSVAAARSSRGQRMLCLLPESSLSSGWDEAVHRVPDLEVMTMGEFAVALVASGGGVGGSRTTPRPLPPAGSVMGEEIRQGLLREVSRLYAQQSGRVPPVDGRALRRLLEEEGSLERMAALGGEGLDAELLRGCIRDARQTHGWLEEGDLIDAAADRLEEDEALVEHWRRHFDGILLDDYHAFDERGRGLVARVFHGKPQWAMADPWLVDRDQSFARWKGKNEGSAIPRQLSSAMENLAHSRPVTGWKLRSRRGSPRGRLHCERVLNLETCVGHINRVVKEEAHADEDFGVVLGHENDRRQMILRLREEGHRVWDADVVARYAAPGPRDLLALAWLVFGEDLTEGRRARLRALVLQSARWDFSDITSSDALEDEVTGLADCVAAAVHQLRAFCDPGHPLRRLSERARAAGLLETLMGRASTRQRLEDFLALAGARSWGELRHQIDVDAVTDPTSTAGVIWALRPRDLHGRGFDHVFHVCSGYEDPTRHLLAASRARKVLHVLYSEVDPFRNDA